MTHALRALLIHVSGIALLGVASLALAGPKHAQTLYDEPPKYPANFKHFDYVNPDAPKGGDVSSWLERGSDFAEQQRIALARALGEVGDVTVVAPEADRSGAANWRTDPQIAGGGYFADLVSHGLIKQARHLFEQLLPLIKLLFSE